MNKPSRQRPRRSTTKPMPRSLRALDALALLLLSFSPLGGMIFFGANRLWTIAPFMATTFIGALWVLLRPFLYPDLRQIRLPPAWIPLLVFIGLATLHLFLAPIPYEARTEWLRLVSYGMAYWGWCELSAIRKRWKILAGLALAVASGIAWYALIQHAQGSNMVWWIDRTEYYGSRASGTYICPNHFAHALAVCSSFGLGLLFFNKAGWPLRLLAGYTLLVSFPALLLSLSRSGVLGLLGGFSAVMLLFFWKKKRKLFWVSLVGAPLVGAGLIFAVFSFSDDFRERIEGAMPGQMDASAAGRLNAWTDTLDMVADRPLLGHGAGSYRWNYGRYQSYPMALWLRYAHNEYLHVAADYGMLGVLILLGFVGTLTFKHVRQFLGSGSKRRTLLSLSLVGVIVCTGVHIVFDFILHIYANTHLLAMLAGVVAGAQTRTGEALPVWRMKKHGPVYVGLMLLCLVGILGSVQLFLGHLYRWKGERVLEDVKLPAAKAFFEKSVATDSQDFFAWEGLGDTYRMQAAWLLNPAQKTEAIEQAAVAYERASTENPLDLAPVFALGSLYVKQGEFEKALPYYEQCVEANPFKSFYRHHLGLLYMRLDRLEDAQKQLRAAVDRDHKNAGARKALYRVRREIKGR